MRRRRNVCGFNTAHEPRTGFVLDVVVVDVFALANGVTFKVLLVRRRRQRRRRVARVRTHFLHTRTLRGAMLVAACWSLTRLRHLSPLL